MFIVLNLMQNKVILNLFLILILILILVHIHIVHDRLEDYSFSMWQHF